MLVTAKGIEMHEHLNMLNEWSAGEEIVQLGTKVNTKLGLPPPPTTTHPPPTIHKLFYMKERS